MKICTKCEIPKEFNEFHKHKRMKDGYSPICKDCKKECGSEYYNNNKEEINEKNKLHYNKNRKNILKQRKGYYEIEENGNKKRKYNKEYYIENKERIVKRNSEYNKNNPHIVIQHAILSRVLKYKKNVNKIKYENELGYTSSELKNHIGNLFENWMSWDNWGEWHIDHIIPISMFKLETPTSIINSMDNLRPISKEYNLSKGNKLDDSSNLIIDKYDRYLIY